MPTYSYECRKCGHVLDVFHGINARPRVKCGKCGRGCKRLLGAGAGILFKGSGFYETDYKRANRRGKDRSQASQETEAKSEAKTPKSEKTGKGSGPSEVA